MSFGCERSCSSHRRVSNVNSKVPQGGIYPHIQFERDMLNIFRVGVSTSSGSTGGGRCGRGGSGDTKTIISLNTSFGDIIIIVIQQTPAKYKCPINKINPNGLSRHWQCLLG